MLHPNFLRPDVRFKAIHEVRSGRNIREVHLRKVKIVRR
jgi:hypothetical protein